MCTLHLYSNARDLREQLRRAYRFAENEISVGARADARLPSGYNADAQRRPPFARDGDQIPAAAVGQADVGHQHIVWCPAIS